MNQQNKQQKFIKEWIEICKTEEEISLKKRKMEEEEKENMATKKQKMIDEIMKEMEENDEQISKLKKENDALKFKQARMEAYLKKTNLSIPRYILPFELMNELFGSMPVKNAFGLLTKIPNGLLARNVQKMINGIKIAIKNNKWNEKDCGHLLAIIDDGLNIINSGLNERNCVRTILPNPIFKLATNKPIISFYFEVQIIKKTGNYGIAIGFCTHQEAPIKKGQWPATQWPGFVKNSIGIVEKGGICIDDTVTEFESPYGCFMNGDVVGIGIIHCPANSSMKYFATWNGQLLGKIELPQKFANLQLFPAIGFKHNGDSIRANFGKEEWSYKQFDQLLN